VLSEWKPNDFRKIYSHLLPGPGNSRFSLLDRYHVIRPQRNDDVFIIQNGIGDEIGALVVGNGKRIIGESGVAWPGDDIITSSPENPIRLVEGPYDVLYTRDVCVFGLFNPHALSMLRGHYVVLCPDGDVWGDESKLRVIRRAAYYDQFTCLGVEYLPDGKDPDEVMAGDRHYIPLEDLNWKRPIKSYSRRLQEIIDGG
jgi:hypothetical protein